ncbi:MAG: response regulator, partial [Actinomycetota bacterium]
VEDNTVNQQLAVLLLQKVGYRADVAGNGVEALEALERQPYDIVLMDVEMPEMDGLEATRSIRQRWPRERQPHIIALTANAMQGERELCINAGMDDYLTKPVRIEELVEALRHSARRRRGPRSTLAVDPAVIRRLVTSFGVQGHESVVALIDAFLGHGPDQLAMLWTALRRHEVEEVRRGAHTLKSNAATFGATSLAGLCHDLEAAAKAGTLDRETELLSRIEAELKRVTGDLERTRAELGR